MSNSTPTTCPRCGCSLENRSIDNLCAKCLGELNFATDTVTPDADRPQDSAAPFTPAEVAALFPQLEILEVLGRGGMGIVYKARQKTLGRQVALKLLAPERVADPRFAERFAREAQALATLSHPNIVTIHDFGLANGVYYLLMEYVDGVNLRQALAAGRLKPEQALAVVPPICEALQYAHEQGIVHRDIKPENLLLDKNGRVKIADFGIAKMLGEQSSGQDVAESQPAGTPQYMAPEQKECRAADHRADIYSLGVVLYEMLTGELPTEKLQPPSRRVEVDVRIDEIVLRALEAKPERRYQTAAELRTHVATLGRSGGEAVSRNATDGGTTPTRFSRVAIAGACLVALGVLSLFLSFFVDDMAAPHMMPDGATIASYHRPTKSAAPALLGAALLYAFFATLLGGISVTQIRRAKGQLDGLWLAVFDSLFFPLFALDALILSMSASSIYLLLKSSESSTASVGAILVPTCLGVLTVALVIAVDYFVIQAVWRAVRPVDEASRRRPVEQATPTQLATRHNGSSPLKRLPIYARALSGVGLVAWLASTFIPSQGRLQPTPSSSLPDQLAPESTGPSGVNPSQLRPGESLKAPSPSAPDAPPAKEPHVKLFMGEGGQYRIEPATKSNSDD